MDTKEIKPASQTPETSTPVAEFSTTPNQNLSSEESYSKDYELFSKKSNNTLLYIVLGVVVFLIVSAAIGLYFTGIIKF